MFRATAKYTVVLCFISCTTPKNSNENNPSATLLDEAAQKKLTEMHEETEVGRNMAGRLLQFYGTVDDEQLLAYVNQVGNFVGTYGDFPERRYMFAILDSEQVNAFACPGGYILITKGAVRNAQSEADLAGVLGHEIAHVGRRHMLNVLQKMTPTELDTVSKEVDRLKLPPEVALRKRPDPSTQSEAGKTLARYLSGSTAGLSIFQAAKAGMALILEKGLGADLEYEADREGVRYAVRAGYYPPGLSDFLCRIDNGMPGKVDLCKTAKVEVAGKAVRSKTVLEKTHPPVADRIKNIGKILAELNANDITGAKGKSRFEKAVSVLPPVK